MESTLQKDHIFKEIATLEEKIQDWKKVNSQSNPSAVMELRELKRSLVKWQKLLETISHLEKV